MADRDELLQIIRQEFSPYVKTADGLLYWPAVEDRGHGRMRVARVDDKQALYRESSKILSARWRSKKALDVMIGVQGGTYLNVSIKLDARVVLILRTKASAIRGELVLFKYDLVTVGLEGRWRIWCFCEDEIRVMRVALQDS